VAKRKTTKSTKSKATTAKKSSKTAKKATKSAHETSKPAHSAKTHEPSVMSNVSSTSSRPVKSQESSNMKVSLIIGAIVIVLLVILLVVLGNQNYVAKVGSEIITEDELNAAYNGLPTAYKDVISKKEYLEDVMVSDALLLDASKGVSEAAIDEAYHEFIVSSGLTEDSVQELLDMQNLTKERLREVIRIKLYLEDALGESIAVADEEVKSFYDAQSDSFTDPEGNVLPYAEVEAQIRQFMVDQKIQQAAPMHIEALKENTNIKINYKESSVAQNTADTSESQTGELSGTTFKETGDDVCYEDGKPVVRMFSTTWCPHCSWIKGTYDSVVQEYVDQGLIAAYHWEIDTGDNTLTTDVETQVPESEMAVYQQYNPQGSIPTFVVGCTYSRVGNGYEQEQDLAAEEQDLRNMIDMLIAQ